MYFSIDPNTYYALFRAADTGSDLQTHIVIDLRVSKELDQLVSELENVPEKTSCLLVTQYQVALSSGLGAALDDMALHLALEEFSDDWDGAPYPGSDHYSGMPLQRAVQQDQDLLFVKGSQLEELLGTDPDLIGEDGGEVQVSLKIIPTRDKDFWIRPVFSVSNRATFMEIESTGGRLPWSMVRRRFLELSE
jgi:hypothetical protein